MGRILLVEDDPHDVELALSALREHNLAGEVVVATDGAEALDYLRCAGRHRGRRPGNPVVVFLDLKLPKLDGLQVLEQLKRDPALRTVPVVMLTSSREEQDLTRSYNLGANAYVVKPVDFAEFVQALKDLGVFWAVVNQPPPGTMGAGGTAVA